MEATFTQMTVEYLGSDATERDLSEFRAACERVLPAFDGDEQSATDYVWNNGDMRLSAGVCIYCEQPVTDHESVPPVGDETAWAEMAKEHETDCEWIATRAHRQEELA